MEILYGFIVAFAVVPPALLSRAWYKMCTTNERVRFGAWIVLALATASSLLELAELLLPETWGQLRSTRLNVIGINLAVSLGCLLASAILPSKASGPLACASMALICLWMYASVVNSVV